MTVAGNLRTVCFIPSHFPPLSLRLIHGFMDKTEAQNVLLQVQPGTFLIRFSDSEAGGVSVTWVAGEQHHTITILYLKFSFSL